MLENKLKDYILKYIDKELNVGVIGGAVIEYSLYQRILETKQLILQTFGLSPNEAEHIISIWIGRRVGGPYIVEYRGTLRYFVGSHEFDSWMAARKRWKLLNRGY